MINGSLPWSRLISGDRNPERTHMERHINISLESSLRTSSRSSFREWREILRMEDPVWLFLPVSLSVKQTHLSPPPSQAVLSMEHACAFPHPLSQVHFPRLSLTLFFLSSKGPSLASITCFLNPFLLQFNFSTSVTLLVNFLLLFES